MTRNIAIYIFDEMEVLDFAGPFEVFFSADREKMKSSPDTEKPFEVFTVADTQREITARGGLKVLPAYSLKDHPHVDVLIIPGGIVDAELSRPEIINWIKNTAARAEITASVCTGAFLLAKADLLRGKPATTHWKDTTRLQQMFPDTQVKTDTRWVDIGQVVTSAGISAGIGMSLHLVERLAGRDLAERTTRQMEFDWDG